MNPNDPGSILIVVALALLAFLIFRELVCWYWKINQSIALLTEIRDLLKNLGTPSFPPGISPAGGKTSTPTENPSHNMTSAEDYASAKGCAVQEVIEKLRTGDITGRQIDGKWFVAE
jgi:hypothetical protein